jgi:N-methylhydantoinase B
MTEGRGRSQRPGIRRGPAAGGRRPTRWGDAFRLEVLRHRCEAIANEMSVALQRAAYSTNIKTRRDHSCAVTDPEGRIIAQSFSQPAHLGTLSYFVPRIIRAYGADRMRAGDGIMCNDGHLGGIHLNDVATVVPVFVEGEIIAYLATMAHHLDVGGGTPGSIGIHAEHIQEGLIIPPTRIMRDGELDEAVTGLILRNVRAVRETAGDIRAQFAASATGRRRILELVESDGVDGLAAAFSGILEYTERRVRRALAALPRGTWAAEGRLDGDGVSDEPLRVAVAVTLDGHVATFDLTGTAPQRPSSINTTFAMTFASCAYAIRVHLDPDIPVNDGFYRLVRVIAPPGSIANSVSPAAIGAGADTGMRVCETALRALAGALPAESMADAKGTVCNVAIAGTDPRTGEYFVFYEAIAGGYGARAGQDGMDAVQPHFQNTENAPIEETEARYPLRVLRYGLVPDSEGPGRFRGGLGLRRDYVAEGDVVLSVMAERSTFEPEGLFGGEPGRSAHFLLNPGPAGHALGSKFSVPVPAGDVMSLQLGGGGGYGPPLERDPAAVAADVRSRRVSPARAAARYGVSVTADGQVDARRTAAARAAMAAATPE